MLPAAADVREATPAACCCRPPHRGAHVCHDAVVVSLVHEALQRGEATGAAGERASERARVRARSGTGGGQRMPQVARCMRPWHLLQLMLTRPPAAPRRTRFCRSSPASWCSCQRRPGAAPPAPSGLPACHHEAPAGPQQWWHAAAPAWRQRCGARHRGSKRVSAVARAGDAAAGTSWRRCASWLLHTRYAAGIGAAIHGLPRLAAAALAVPACCFSGSAQCYQRRLLGRRPKALRSRPDVTVLATARLERAPAAHKGRASHSAAGQRASCGHERCITSHRRCHRRTQHLRGCLARLLGAARAASAAGEAQSHAGCVSLCW